MNISGTMHTGIRVGFRVVEKGLDHHHLDSQGNSSLCLARPFHWNSNSGKIAFKIKVFYEISIKTLVKSNHNDVTLKLLHL